MFWAEAAPALAYLLGVLAIPESPRFLVARGRTAEAERVFARAGGGDVAGLVSEVRQSLAGAARPRLTDLLEPGTRLIRPVVWVGIGLSALQQLVGINIVFYYGEVLWEAAGSTPADALRNNVITGLTNILATVVAITLIDRVGRKPLLLAGSVGMAVTLAAEAAVFATGHLDAAGRLQLGSTGAVAGLVAANLYVVAFGVSWGPVVWVMLGEMFGNRYRGAALAVAASAQWLANFLVTVTFPPLLAEAGLAGAYAVYTLAAVLSFFFVLWFVTETRGKRLEQM